MRSVDTLARSHYRARGFTMIELMVALAISSILAVIAVQTMTGQGGQTRAQEAQRFLIEDLPKAMIGYARSTSASSRLNSAAQLEEFGVSRDTAWGELWSITDNALANAAHTVRYPIGGNDADVRGQALATFLAGDNEAGDPRFRFIENASYSNGNLTVIYRSLL